MSRLVTGLAERCYNGISIIRGYAPADILIQSSVAHSSYQRGKDEDHIDDILNFIQKGDFVFLPEIILSYDYKNIYDTKYQDLFEQLDSVNMLRDKELNFQIKKLKSVHSRHIILSFPDKIEKKLFRRLDGNHRLEALAKLSQERQREIKVPFAIILFCSEYDESQMLKNEMMIFHNLNTKGLKLTSEQQIRGLLKLFSADELEDFGDELPSVKRYITRYKTDDFRCLKHFLLDAFPSLATFWNSPRSILQKSLQTAKRKRSIEPKILHRALQYIDNNVFALHKELQTTKCMELLPIYIYYATSSLDAVSKMSIISDLTGWILKNKLHMLKSVDPESVITIFDKFYEILKKRIFVAMPFDSKLDFVFEAIQNSVKKINQNYHSDIPAPIRIDKQIVGFSYDIVQTILDNIKGAGLLIADLTAQNANVYYEAGYAQGLIHAKLGNTTQILYLISNSDNPDEPFEEGKFDIRHYKMVPYDNSGNGKSDLENKLTEELKAFYKIK